MVLTGDGGCKVAIDVLACEGHEWLSCRVSIAVAGFTADYPASFDLHAFTCFHRELSAAYSTLTGTASFRTLEGMLELDVEMTPTGGAAIRGLARNYSPTVEFDFAFGTDQTYLGPVCRQLDEVLERYG